MSGWTSNVFPSVNGNVKVIAFNGKRVLHLDKLAPADVGSIDFDLAWKGLPFKVGKPGPVMVDFAALASAA